MNLLAIPSCLGAEVAGAILAGGADKAVEAGAIQPSRHASYIRLYDQAKQIPDWAR